MERGGGRGEGREIGWGGRRRREGEGGKGREGRGRDGRREGGK